MIPTTRGIPVTRTGVDETEERGVSEVSVERVL